MHYWHRNQKGKNSLGLSKSISKLVEGRLFNVRRKWVQVAKKSTGIRGVSQFPAPDVSCSHSLQHKLNRLYLKDEFAGELISSWGVKEGKSHSPSQVWLSFDLWRPKVLSWNLIVAALYIWNEGLTEISQSFKVIWTKLVAESDNVFPGTLQPSLVVRDALNFSCYSTHLRAGELLFGRSYKCYDLAWNKRGDLERVLDYPCALFLWDLWKATLCPSVCKGDWNGRTSHSWV